MITVVHTVAHHHRRAVEHAALVVAARTPLGALAAAATAAWLADAGSTAVAGAVSLAAFLTWRLLARPWQRPASHLPVLRLVYPLLVATSATATAALACAGRVDGLQLTDWLLVLIVADTASMLTERARARGFRPRRVRVAFIGAGEAARRLAADLTGARVVSYRLLGRVDVHGDDGGPVPVIAELGALRAAIVRERIDLLVLGSGVARLKVFDALAGCLDLRIQLTELSAFYEDVFGNVPTAEINAAWFAHLVDADARHPSPAAKRTLDVCLALALGVLTLPLLACAAMLIRLDGGAPFFAQRRIGEGGRPFRLYKLRTMRVGSGDETMWAQDSDPRATHIGRFLRRSHIDELPQLWNILRGEMSLVGPRPEQLGFVVRLEAALPFYQRRHLIRPGLTGWAQVRCGYAGTDAGAAWKLCNDLYYVKYRSLGLDLLVLIETVGLLILGSAAVAHMPLTPWAETDSLPDPTVANRPSATAPPGAPAAGATAMALTVARNDDQGSSLVR